MLTSDRNCRGGAARRLDEAVAKQADENEMVTDGSWPRC